MSNVYVNMSENRDVEGKKRDVDILLMMPDETMKDSGSTKTEEMKREKKES